MACVTDASGRPVRVRVDRDRLWHALMELKEIGGYADDATGLRGVRRLALTDEDAAARRRVVGWMGEAGLRVRVDRIGNVYGSRAGTDPALPCVLVGSHIDTVATGGAFDGTLGVLGGIEVVRTFDEHGVRTLRTVEVGFFTEEEGVRFGTDMLGSAVTAGRISLHHAHALADEHGATVGAELVRIGFDGSAPERRPVPYAYLECHIEQGRARRRQPHPARVLEPVRLRQRRRPARQRRTPAGERAAHLIGRHMPFSVSGAGHRVARSSVPGR
jgi:N-carbamoyl-L-amino-acid hydrolase